MRAVAHAAHAWLTQAEPWLNRAVPFMLAVFIATIAECALLYTRHADEVAISEAAAELEFVSGLLTKDLNALLATDPDASAGNLLTRAIPARALAHDRQIVISDARGIVATAAPGEDPRAGPLSDYLGTARLPIAHGDRAEAARITLADGREALAVSRPLQEPLGQITFVQTVRGALEANSDWWWHWGIYLGSAGLVVLAVGAVYLWQAARARVADLACEQVREHIDTALDSGGCGLWDWDVAGARVYWSDSMYRLLGMRPGEGVMTIASVEAMVHPDDGPLMAPQRFTDASRTRTLDHVFRIRHASGDWLWLRARAQLTRSKAGKPHYVGIAVDITAEKQLAAMTATADVRLRDAIETISEAFVLWDADNRLVMCNSKFQRFHNLPAEAVVVGTPYREIVNRGDAPAVQTQFTLAERPHADARTYKAQLADGRWLQISERRTRDGGYVSVGTDITGVKASEVDLMDSKRRLTASIDDLRRHKKTLETQAQQLAELAEKYLDQKAQAECADRAKSAFLANMSHQLWTPLNHMIGFAQMMEEGAFGALNSPRYAGYPAHIRRSGEYLRDVVADVLEMTRLERGEVRLAKKVVPLREVSELALAKVREAAVAKDIELSSTVMPQHSVFGDAWAIEKILTTVLHNAVKFTPAGGRVVLRTRMAGRSVDVFVADTGCGIAPNDLARLARPFEQIGEAMEDGMKGSGLGLAIASSLARLHGGKIRLRSRSGKGTVAMLHLPARLAPALGSAPPPAGADRGLAPGAERAPNTGHGLDDLFGNPPHPGSPLREVMLETTEAE